MTARELRERLRRHYIEPGKNLPGGVFLTEVQSPGSSYGTGGRRIDALYLGFTSSRGRLLEGHEIKVSRSDWLNELKEIEKAETWFGYTNRWWLVVPSTQIAKPEELPVGWGLMVPNARTKTRLDVVVKAPEREANISLGLLLEIAKKLDTERANGIRDERQERDRLIREEVDRQVGTVEAARASRSEHSQAVEALRKLAELLGVNIIGGPTTKGPFVKVEELAPAIRDYVQDRLRAERGLQSVRRQLETVRRLVDESLEEIAADEQPPLRAVSS